MKQFIIEDIVIKLGENAKENWELSFNSKQSHIWIHLSSFPSSHVIIEHDFPSYELIYEAGLLCKSHSKYRNLKNLKISVTTCSNLKKGDKTGEVMFKSNRKVKDYLL